MLYKTLEQALNAKSVVVISSENYEHNGESRKWIKVRKLNGKKVFRIAQYGNGMFSSGV